MHRVALKHGRGQADAPKSGKQCNCATCGYSRDNKREPLWLCNHKHGKGARILQHGRALRLRGRIFFMQSMSASLAELEAQFHRLKHDFEGFCSVPNRSLTPRTTHGLCLNTCSAPPQPVQQHRTRNIDSSRLQEDAHRGTCGLAVMLLSQTSSEVLVSGETHRFQDAKHTCTVHILYKYVSC